MQQHKITNDSFRETPNEVIEALAMRAEYRYERALKGTKENDKRRANVLFFLCNTLWDVLSLKVKGNLTKNKDKEAFANYLLYTTSL